MLFFFIGALFIAKNILFAIGLVPGTWSVGRRVLCCFAFVPSATFALPSCVFVSSGFILMIQLFAAGGKKILVGLLVMLVTCSFAMIALVGSLLLIKVSSERRLSLALVRSLCSTRSHSRRPSYRFVFQSSGFILLRVMSTNKVVGTMMIVLGCLWAVIATAAVIVTIRV